jgi:hypothetical protein
MFLLSCVARFNLKSCQVVVQGWKTRKGSDQSGPDVFCIGREIAAMDNRQIQEPKSISRTRHEQIESQVYKQCESLDDESDLQLVLEGA